MRKAGTRPVAAPLSDPTATPDDAHVPAVDAALRRVCAELLSADGAQTGGYEILGESLLRLRVNPGSSARGEGDGGVAGVPAGQGRGAEGHEVPGGEAASRALELVHRRTRRLIRL